MKDTNIIRLHNAVFYAYHGVASGEQDLGGKYEVDFEVYCDFHKAAVEDKLEYTLNYELVYDLIKNIICKEKYLLIETVTYKIANEVFEKYKIAEKVAVKVRKYSPPVKGVVSYVETEVIRERD
jgi:7,8-dihydroneopterin aldolase/epimerase/oxygenase